MINPLSLNISGLMAASKKAADSAQNIANSGSAGSLDPTSASQPYQAVDTVTTPVAGGGVKAVSVARNPAYVPSYEPNSPLANEDGMVATPNVNLDEELINLKAAEQAYKANAQALRMSRDMHDTLLTAIDKKV